ncbi:hypothetical protein Pse7367_1424 [Thalassoporum mexicanum PCC 7367]|uniref:hypothetical protein n=1 Tax=Thalassoporum mexicanum TaxID=3457544 RepID=UPI00029FBA8E|nr:hypothetical protein [Pseudanabaena sp. PCC 7367]AFY69715.1 hypothetical protein Pse7367_1424 [Pseudanabaena sp. PCC 7367]
MDKSQVEEQFQAWIDQQIHKLSTDALVNSGAFTCTACGDQTGDYLIEYEGLSFRYSKDRTYAFLDFVAKKLSRQAQ